MDQPDAVFRDIADTARWAAVYRARESERPDALFRDPLARQLAGPEGERIAGALPNADRDAWAWVARTYLIDQFVMAQIRDGVDMVINLAAGLDTRPFRLVLPSELVWIEMDLPDLLAYKEAALAGERPACVLERISLDLADVRARRDLFGRLARRATKTLIVTEGLLIYLPREDVRALAEDLAAHPSFQRWTLDLQSPGLVRMIRRRWGRELGRAGAPPVFGPDEGPGFFAPCGWRAVEVRSVFTTAVRAGRVPFPLRLLALLPESKGRQGSRPWTGICLLQRA